MAFSKTKESEPNRILYLCFSQSAASWAQLSLAPRIPAREAENPDTLVPPAGGPWHNGKPEMVLRRQPHAICPKEAGGGRRRSANCPIAT